MLTLMAQSLFFFSMFPKSHDIILKCLLYDQCAKYFPKCIMLSLSDIFPGSITKSYLQHNKWNKNLLLSATRIVVYSTKSLNGTFSKGVWHEMAKFRHNHCLRYSSWSRCWVSAHPHFSQMGINM